MEEFAKDYAPLLWVLVGLAAILAKAGKKKPKSEQKQAHGEAWLTPQREENQFPRRTAAQKPAMDSKALRTKKQTRFSAQSSSLHFTEVEPLTEVESEMTQDPLEEKIPLPISTANTILDEEFDLRKAVIYSELLKPKFDE